MSFSLKTVKTSDGSVYRVETDKKTGVTSYYSVQSGSTPTLAEVVKKHTSPKTTTSTPALPRVITQETTKAPPKQGFFARALSKVMTLFKSEFKPVESKQTEAQKFIADNFETTKARVLKERPTDSNAVINKETYKRLEFQYAFVNGQYDHSRSSAFYAAQNYHALNAARSAAEPEATPVTPEIVVPTPEKKKSPALSFIEQHYETQRTKINERSKPNASSSEKHMETKKALFRAYSQANPTVDRTELRREFIKAFRAYNETRV